MIFAGAGSAIQFSLNHSRSPTSVSAASSSETQSAYLVTPAAHIGRVVTGIVFVAQETRLLSTEFASHTSASAEEFGLAAISFADKLAEQGYKVLALNLFPTNARATDASAVAENMRVVEQAALFLKQKQDIQRVALCGVGAGADLAIKMSIEQPALLDCAIVMCPNGELAWTAPSDSSGNTPAPTLLLVGDKNPFASSAHVRLSVLLAFDRACAQS